MPSHPSVRSANYDDVQDESGADQRGPEGPKRCRQQRLTVAQLYDRPNAYALQPVCKVASILLFVCVCTTWCLFLSITHLFITQLAAQLSMSMCELRLPAPTRSLRPAASRGQLPSTPARPLSGSSGGVSGHPRSGSRRWRLVIQSFPHPLMGWGSLVSGDHSAPPLTA